jgi:rhodanese-related sulfurtransferase
MHSNWFKRFFPVLLVAVFSFAAVSVAEEGFPLRAKFPQVKYMTTEALNKDYQKVIVVDVRSKIEFDVIHVNKAVHEPIATAMFANNLEKIRSKTGELPIAFYCNGHSCAKSYEAADLAAKAGFQNVYAYDAGIPDWVKAHPEKTTLMGKTPANAGQLISKEMFEKRTISFAEFKKRAASPDAMVIDAREPFQRKEIPQLPGTLRNVPSDRLAELIKKGEFKGNQLLILDAVGKQVEWIQYYLEAGGYKNYYFLKKGVLSAIEAGAVK